MTEKIIPEVSAEMRELAGAVLLAASALPPAPHGQSSPAQSRAHLDRLRQQAASLASIAEASQRAKEIFDIILQAALLAEQSHRLATEFLKIDNSLQGLHRSLIDDSRK